MLTFAEFAEHLERAAVRLKAEIVAPTLAVMTAAEEDAKHNIVGHEMGEWAPLADSTVAEKTKLGYVGHVSRTDPLLRSGEFRESIKSDAEPTPGGAIGTVGSSDKRAEYFEFGTSKMPPRPVFSLALRRAEPIINKTLGEFVVESIERI